MPKKREQKLLAEYPKYCPKCRKYLRSVYETCPDCRVILIDAQIAHKREKKIALVRNILIAAVLVFATYGIQKNERKYYNQSVRSFVTGKFHDSRVEFSKAFSANPFYKFFSSAIETIKYKITHRTVVIEIK